MFTSVIMINVLSLGHPVLLFCDGRLVVLDKKNQKNPKNMFR